MTVLEKADFVTKNNYDGLAYGLWATGLCGLTYPQVSSIIRGNYKRLSEKGMKVVNLAYDRIQEKSKG